MGDKSVVQVRIVNASPHPLPCRQSPEAAGLDVHAWLSKPLTLAPMDMRRIPTGLYVEIPKGFEIQIRPRSGLAFKQGLTLLNSPGTIDSDYRGEIGILLINLSSQPQTLSDGMRIAQMVLAPVLGLRWERCDQLTKSVRGSGGFGSTDDNA